MSDSASVNSGSDSQFSGDEFLDAALADLGSELRTIGCMLGLIAKGMGVPQDEIDAVYAAREDVTETPVSTPGR